jgi:phosphinothricin acetyltransferase
LVRDRFTIRDAAIGDSSDIAQMIAIYAHHVCHGTASFELEAPSPATMADRFSFCYEAGLPVLVIAGPDRHIAGYAYLSAFHQRAAYSHTVEDSIYIDPGLTGQGLGKMLLTALIARAQHAGKRQIMAVIGDSDNHASIGLHRAMGFTPIGIARDIGFKFGRFLDVVYMQRDLR